MVFISTNEGKFKELQFLDQNLAWYNLKSDIKEVLGSTREIILHKVKDFQVTTNINDFLIEDSVFNIWSEEKQTWELNVDIKYTYPHLPEKTPIVWISTIGHYIDGKVSIFQAETPGFILKAKGEKFYDNFLIQGNNLKEHFLAHNYLSSARVKAFAKVKSQESMESNIDIDSILPWRGEYQVGE